METLTPLQKGLLRFYANRVGEAVAEVKVHRQPWWGRLGSIDVPTAEYKVAEVIVRLTDGGTLHLYGSLGDSEVEGGTRLNHEHQFVAAFDTPTADIPRVIAFARVHERFAGQLGDGHSFLLDQQSSLRTCGYTNVLVTGADLHAPFREHVEVATGGVPSRFFALVPLDTVEWSIKVKAGTAAVLEHFRREGRDLLRLKAPPG